MRGRPHGRTQGLPSHPLWRKRHSADQKDGSGRTSCLIWTTDQTQWLPRSGRHRHRSSCRQKPNEPFRESRDNSTQFTELFHISLPTVSGHCRGKTGAYREAPRIILCEHLRCVASTHIQSSIMTQEHQATSKPPDMAPVPVMPDDPSNVCPACKQVRTSGEAADPGDTGIQIAMRTLLSIVAGLLIADMLKICVRLVIGDGWTCPSPTDAALAIAALLFIGKVVIDNVLHYHEADWVLQSRSYWLRWVLVSLDLASYSLCYGVVALFDGASGGPIPIYPTVVWSFAALAGVELLHWRWCERAMALACDGKIPCIDNRMVALEKWRKASRKCFVIGGLALTTMCYMPTDKPGFAAWIFIAFCLASIVIYAVARHDEYLRRRPK